MNIPYTCKICKTPGVAQAEDGVDMFTIEKWIPLLCCNRCADYLESRRTIGNAILNLLVSLSRARRSMVGQKLFTTEANIRETLIGLTKRFVTLVSDYHRKANVWDEEFVNQLMDKPDSAYNICRQYAKTIKSS